MLGFGGTADGLDRCVVELLSKANLGRPPVDALQVASQLGMVVAVDRGQQARGRCARVASPDARAAQAAILLRPEPRSERIQWTVAHEIGEHLMPDLLARLGGDGDDLGVHAREQVANAFAGRLLTPTKWLRSTGTSCDWDLPTLKSTFTTASHELLAQRMLDFDTPMVLAIYDHGAMTRRRTNCHSASFRTCALERDVRRRASETGRPAEDCGDGLRVRAWPIHEPDWKREIVRIDLLCDDD